MEDEARTRKELIEELASLRLRVESFHRLEREKSDFYAMITHDIKGPLTAIIGYAELLNNTPGLDEDTREAVEGVIRNGERLNKLLEDFLLHSRLESGMALMDIRPEDPAMLIREVGLEFRAQAEKKGLSISAAASPGLPCVLADRQYLARALYNLVQNAVNYTPPGGRINLDAVLRGESDESRIVISVSDDGPGIPDAEQEKVFRKYYRSSASAGVAGSGLGLPIVRAVAEAHGGSVELVSEAGRGSTFRIFLPACGYE